MAITVAFKRRTVYRVAGFLFVFLILRQLFSTSTPPHEIAHDSYIERVTKRTEKYLDVHRLPFLQSRMGREDDADMLSDYVDSGVHDFWKRFQIPLYVHDYISKACSLTALSPISMNSADTMHVDAQAVRSSIEELLSLHGWVVEDCLSLNPFGQNKHLDSYDDLASDRQMYYIAMVIHSADHFLVDQLATIVQLARKLGTRNIFVSMLDYYSQDSTSTLLDLAESVLTLLSVPFRIRRVSILTVDDKAGYYPLEEAYTRNLVLEPLLELRDRRGIKFNKVIWLKGFTCPNDILESIRVTQVNQAAMTCGMDWAENNGFFVFSDRWRTRDMDGDQFRVSRSTSASAPPREDVAAKRYAQHLPFQVFCCESGTHIVDPAQSYYRGIKYRHSSGFYNLSREDGTKPPTEWDPYAECMDSTQAWFCRDIWVSAAEQGIKLINQPMLPNSSDTKTGSIQKRHANSKRTVHVKRQGGGGGANPPDAIPPVPPADAAAPPADGAAAKLPPKQPLGGLGKIGDDKVPENVGDVKDDSPPPPAVKPGESDADRGSDFDTVPENSPPPLAEEQTSFNVPNSHFESARILINPRTVTTYAGVSHTKLANDLFGSDKDAESNGDYDKNRYVLEEWVPAPDSYVCQEQRSAGS